MRSAIFFFFSYEEDLFRDSKQYSITSTILHPIPDHAVDVSIQGQLE
jgi:hypothetical protein